MVLVWYLQGNLDCSPFDTTETQHALKNQFERLGWDVVGQLYGCTNLQI